MFSFNGYTLEQGKATHLVYMIVCTVGVLFVFPYINVVF